MDDALKPASIEGHTDQIVGRPRKGLPPSSMKRRGRCFTFESAFVRFISRTSMNHQRTIFMLVSAAFVAQAGANTVDHSGNHCLKLLAPVPRAECEEKRRAPQSAWEKEQQAKKKASDDTQSKKSSLCFERKSTGELVCPN